MIELKVSSSATSLSLRAPLARARGSGGADPGKGEGCVPRRLRAAAPCRRRSTCRAPTRSPSSSGSRSAAPGSSPAQSASPAHPHPTGWGTLCLAPPSPLPPPLPRSAARLGQPTREPEARDLRAEVDRRRVERDCVGCCRLDRPPKVDCVPGDGPRAARGRLEQASRRPRRRGGEMWGDVGR